MSVKLKIKKSYNKNTSIESKVLSHTKKRKKNIDVLSTPEEQKEYIGRRVIIMMRKTSNPPGVGSDHQTFTNGDVFQRN